ncbi:MAG: ROK family protein [candidate division KSB1 bacterium]|nr:ROK family protein [candidate division KSB1 bacterium]
MNQNYIVGVDFGGTKIKTGIITPKGEVTGDIITVPTQAEDDRDSIIKRMVQSIEAAMASVGCTRKDISGIGIGSPGPLNIKDGIVLTPPNLPTFQNVPLRKKITEAFELPVYVNNDANAFVLGECYFGAGKDARIAFGVTLGTGFGSGIVMDKKIYLGVTETAAEIWCSPYQEGILEDYISGRGITKMYQQRTGQKSEPPEIAQAARQGQAEAIDTWKEFGHHLGKALAYMVNILDPDVGIIGGSLSKAYDLFEEEMFQTLRRYINPNPLEHVRILKAQLGDQAGFIGAACLVLESQLGLKMGT